MCCLPEIQNGKSSTSLIAHMWNEKPKDDLTCKQRVLGSVKSRPNLNYSQSKISTHVAGRVPTVTSYSVLLPSGACKPKLSDGPSAVFSGFWVTASNVTSAFQGLHPLVIGEPVQDTKHLKYCLFPQGSNLPHVTELGRSTHSQSQPWGVDASLCALLIRIRKYYLQVVGRLCKGKQNKQDYFWLCNHFCCAKGFCLPAFLWIFEFVLTLIQG